LKRIWIASGVLAAAAVSVAWWWSKQPKTPQAMFEVRCATCHELPDLSRFEDEQIAGIVRTMRMNNGAADVIDEEEARIIVDYILSQRRTNERSAESRR